jgi:WD40 repeat protein
VRPSRKRPRAEPEADADAAVAALKPQPTECTICYDPCTLTGRHRLAALKCGHLFGKKCIERWVAVRSQSVCLFVLVEGWQRCSRLDTVVQERKTCPNCNMVVRRADIRVLFSDHVAVVDNSGIEAMTQKWEAEKNARIQAETDLSRAKLQLQMLTADSHRHQAEAVLWKRKFEQLQAAVARGSHASASARNASPSQPLPLSSRYPNGASPELPMGSQFKPISPFDPASQRTSSPILSSPPFSSLVARSQPTRSARANLFTSREPESSSRPLNRPDDLPQFTEVFRVPLINSRVFAIAPSGSMMCVGDSFTAASHGIIKLSTVDPRHSARIAVHQTPVRDVAISAREDLALTVAFDGKLAVTNLNSHSVVLQIPLPPARRQGWSCALSASDPNAMYCGFHDGTVLKYDMRRPGGGNGGVLAAFALQEKQPVHSIKLFPHARSIYGDGLAAATFSGVSVWDRTDQVGDGGAIPFLHCAHASVLGCCSLSISSSSGGEAVVSSRTQALGPASHLIFNLSEREPLPTMTPIGSPLRGHRTPSVLTRSTIWRDTVSGKLRVASGDDASNRLLVWDVMSGVVVQRLAPPRVTATSRSAASVGTEHTIMDVQHSPCGGSRGGRELLGVLRQKEVALFSCRVGAS